MFNSCIKINEKDDESIRIETFITKWIEIKSTIKELNRLKLFIHSFYKKNIKPN